MSQTNHELIEEIRLLVRVMASLIERFEDAAAMLEVAGES